MVDDDNVVVHLLLICCIPVIILKCDMGAWWTLQSSIYRLLSALWRGAGSSDYNQSLSICNIHKRPHRVLTSSTLHEAQINTHWSTFLIRWDKSKAWMASSWMTWWIVFASCTNCIGFAKYSNTSLLENKNGESEINKTRQQDRSNSFYEPVTQREIRISLHPHCNTL